ncbi:hypothetical protein ZWY2020_007304 [Hordeum vulgare]|nr:hypothetical protein ZWY2020_007304 [Hordeum vulgare]
MEQALEEAEATVETTEHEEHALEEIHATIVEDELKKLNLKKKKPRRREGKNKVVDESVSHPNAYEARLHRNFWDSTFAGPRYGCVKSKGKLEISVEANRATDEEDLARDGICFTPKRAGRSHKMFKVGSCEMEVTVAWSLLLSYG